MAQRTSAIPETAGQVRDRLLKFKQAGPSVEEARAEMLAAKEAATTTGRGTKVPEFIKQASERGQGGNTPTAQPTPAATVVQHAPQNEIPTESRNEVVKDNRTLQALRFNAQQKLQRQGYRAGTRVVLTDEVKKGVITHEEAEALLGSSIQTDEEPKQTEEVIESVAEVPPTPEVPIRVPVEPEEAAKTIDHKHFTGKISRDGKLWVAEIFYKNGAGTERFSANSKDELMLKLLEGKGNGTLRVRKAVQNEKLGADHQDWNYIVQQIRDAYNITEEEYLASPQSVRAAMVDNVQFVETKEFIANNPEYEEKYATDANKERIARWLENKKPQSWPMTSHNLQLAFEDLLADDLLEIDSDYLLKKQVSAAPTAVEVPAQPVATRTEDSAVAAAPAPAAPTAQAQAPAAPVVRKRGTTGLIPGSSSAVVETATRAEDGNKQPEPSVSELRNMPIADLKRIATKDRKYARY